MRMIIRLGMARGIVAAILLGTIVGGVGGSLALAAGEPSAPAGDTGAAEAITNEYCPVMPDELTDPDIWVDYKGTRVYFCCRRCKHKFERDPEKYVANLAAFSKPSEDPFADAAATLLGDDPPPTDAAGEPAEHAHAAGEADEHEHDHDGKLPKPLKWLGEFHMASVNFPVGLLIAGAMAEVLLMMTKRASYASAARFCVWIGALGALASGVLGWFHAGVQIMEDDWVLATHRWLGTSTAVVALAALVLSESHVRRPDAPGRTHRYRVALFFSAILVAAAGFFGGALVYGIDHYAW
jgi:uncharacterized membrane protein